MDQNSRQLEDCHTYIGICQRRWPPIGILGEIASSSIIQKSPNFVKHSGFQEHQIDVGLPGDLQPKGKPIWSLKTWWVFLEIYDLWINPSSNTWGWLELLLWGQEERGGLERRVEVVRGQVVVWATFEKRRRSGARTCQFWEVQFWVVRNSQFEKFLSISILRRCQFWEGLSVSIWEVLNVSILRRGQCTNLRSFCASGSQWAARYLRSFCATSSQWEFEK